MLLIGYLILGPLFCTIWKETKKGLYKTMWWDLDMWVHERRKRVMVWCFFNKQMDEMNANCNSKISMMYVMEPFAPFNSHFWTLIGQPRIFFEVAHPNSTLYLCWGENFTFLSMNFDWSHDFSILSHFFVLRDLNFGPWILWCNL